MREVERRDPEALLPKSLDHVMTFEENKQWVRGILDAQVDLTSKDSDFVPVGSLAQEDRYFAYNSRVNQGGTPSEQVIDMNRQKSGREYRDETEGENPVFPTPDAASTSS